MRKHAWNFDIKHVIEGDRNVVEKSRRRRAMLRCVGLAVSQSYLVVQLALTMNMTIRSPITAT